MSVCGLFELETARNLLEKAQHDLGRLRANPLDTYAAFDLFVTGRHIPDWVYPDSLFPDGAAKVALFKQHIELRVCRHIAEGAKHFVVEDKRHRQVKSTSKSESAWGDAWGDSWGDSWGERALIIELDPSDPDTAILGKRILALDLGERVVKLLESIVP